MITEEQFTKQFDKLTAAFGITKPVAVRDEWYEEFHTLEYFPFLNCIKKLQYGERFPTWSQLQSEYMKELGENRPKHEGCEHCNAGVVLYRGIHPQSGKVSDMAANCGVCARNRIHSMGSADPTSMVKDSIGVLYTEEAREEDRANGMFSEVFKQKVAEFKSVTKVVEKLYGTEDSENEVKRAESLKREEMREALL